MFRIPGVRWLGLAGLAIAAVQISLPAAGQTVMRFNRWVPPTHHVQVRTLEPWAKEVEAATKGRVKIEFTTSSLGAPPRQFDLAREGVAEVTLGNHDYTPARFVLTRAVQLPFVTSSAESLSVAFWRTQEKFFDRANEHDGVKVLGLFVHGPGQVFLNKPIRSLADFNGVKLRVLGPQTAEIAKLFGAVPVNAAATQAYELLSKGVADGSFFQEDGIASFKLDKVVKHGVLFPGGLYNSTFFVVMNKAKFDALSAEDQRAVMSVSGERLARNAGRVWDDQDRIARDIMTKSGVVISQATPDMDREARAKLAGFEQDWLKLAAGKGVNGAEALRFLRAEAAAYKP